MALRTKPPSSSAAAAPSAVQWRSRSWRVKGADVYLARAATRQAGAGRQPYSRPGSSASTFVFDALDDSSQLRTLPALISSSTPRALCTSGQRLEALTLDEFRQGFDPFLAAYLNCESRVAPYGRRAWRDHNYRRRPAANMTMAGPPRAYRRLRGNGISLTGRWRREMGTQIFALLCVRSHAIADAVPAGHMWEPFSRQGAAMGITVEQFLGGAAQSTLDASPADAGTGGRHDYVSGLRCGRRYDGNPVNMNRGRNLAAALARNSPHHRPDSFALKRRPVGDIVQRHPFNKRVQRAGGNRVEPLLQRGLAHLHPVLHHRFERRAAVHKGVELIISAMLCAWSPASCGSAW